MKTLQPLTLLLLLVLLALAWATWDLQRREAAAPLVDLSAWQVPTPAVTTNTTTKAPPAPAMAVCPTCHGKREIHLAQEIACKACGGSGTITGKFSSHGTTICNACRGSGKLGKDVAQTCPSCKGAGQVATAMIANFKACPTCQGVKTIARDELVTCQNCRGTGKNISEMSKHATGTCPFCGGTGKLTRKEKDICPDCFGAGVTYQPPPAPPGT